MTPATITESQVRDLLVVLDGATRIITRISTQIEHGEVSPEQAADKVNQAIAAIIEAGK
jgi:hypothetical protein